MNKTIKLHQKFNETVHIGLNNINSPRGSPSRKTSPLNRNHMQTPSMMLTVLGSARNSEEDTTGEGTELT